MVRGISTCIGIAVAVFAVYGQVAGHEFVDFDDSLYVTGNPNLKLGLSPPGIAWAMHGEMDFDGVRAYIWQPVTWLSYLVDFELHGIDRAGPWLLTNVIWHVASSWVLLAALVALTGRFWPSAFVAALFALHPIQVESVAWVSGRRDVLAGFFANLSLLAYARYVDRRTWSSYAWLMGSFSCSLGAKGTHVALPLLLLLLDYWPLARFRIGGAGGESVRRLVSEKLPLLGLSLATILIQLAPVSITSGPWATDPPWLERMGDGVMALAATLGRWVWPAGLAIVYPTPVQMGLPAPGANQIGAIVLGGIAATLCALAMGQRRGHWIVGWLWFVGMLLPLAGWVPSGLRVMHDRYAYVAMIGLAVLLAFAAADFAKRRRGLRAVVAAVAPVVLVTCALTAWHQAGVWRDSLTLFDHALAVTHRNAIVHFYKGNTLVVDGDYDAARREFEAALEIRPDYPQALQNLGHLYIRLDQPARAIALIERAIALRPNWSHAMTNLGRAQWLNGDPARSLATLEASRALAPQSVDTLYALATVYRASGRLEDALEAYREARRLDPMTVGPQHGLVQSGDRTQ